eukprot:TRINITY_DN6184_c0_g1_i1.p1 TRINITY_DN6184_c0_g1~~TRINITY_DN6184_c0_g1_i1.p1  ORF type:complete len:378 (+),score=101.51 TRINITY_DN6184_c0_g1_i1:97-1230(+)
MATLDVIDWKQFIHASEYVSQSSQSARVDRWLISSDDESSDDERITDEPADELIPDLTETIEPTDQLFDIRPIIQPEVQIHIQHEAGSNVKRFLRPKCEWLWPHSSTEVAIWFEEGWKKENPQQRRNPDLPQKGLEAKWKATQIEMAKQVKIELPPFSLIIGSPNQLRYVGGFDISFAKNSKIDAVTSVVVCEFPSMRVVYETYYMIKLTAPYIPGLLAFREIPSVLVLLEKLKSERPDVYPQCMIVDGNGILHMRGLGQASHLGVTLDMPTLGVAKKLLVVDSITDDVVEQAFEESDDPTTSLPLIGKRTGKELAIALKVEGHPKTLFISPGHRMDLTSAIELVKACMRGNELPEPTFQADGLSRIFLKKNYDNLR